MSGSSGGFAPPPQTNEPLLELRAALALSRVRDLGPLRIRWMMDREGSALAALDAFRRGEWSRPGEGGFDAARPPGRKLLGRLESLRPLPADELDHLAERGIRVVAYRGAGYPARLAHLPDPPTVLYLRGSGGLPLRRVVTVVGTRTATEYGRRMARDLAAGFVRHGCTVVSGMAAGIDAAAHLGALDAGGKTAGVLGWGLDHPKPKSRAALFSAVERHGLLVAELAPRVPPRKGTFPRRNRILAALAEAVVVVQAGHGSGALNTAGHALDLGREVFAVPGPVGPLASEGVHQLLLDGAGLVTRAEDVLSAAKISTDGTGSGKDRGSGRGARGEGLEAPRASPVDVILRYLDVQGPTGADVLAARAGLTAGEATALLLRMELARRIEALPGGRYARARVRE